MKRTMILIASALVAMMAFVGCQPATTPVPQKVTISDSFVQIDAIGTVLSGVYQFDGEGTYYAADGTAMTAQSNGSNLFALTAGGKTYFNEKFTNNHVGVNLVDCLSFECGPSPNAIAAFVIKSGEVVTYFWNGTTWNGGTFYDTSATTRMSGYLITILGTKN